MSTINKLITLSNNDNKDSEKIIDNYYRQFSEVGVKSLICRVKFLVKYVAIPEWVKKRFEDEKSYKLEVNDKGFINSININTCYANIDEHYYLDAAINPGFITVRGGSHRNELNDLVNVDDIEDFLGIKIG